MGDTGDIGCSETLREVERYVDGECLRELTVQVETHLAGCTDCNDHAEFKKHMKLLSRRSVAARCSRRDWRSGSASGSAPRAPSGTGRVPRPHDPDHLDVRLVRSAGLAVSPVPG